MLNHAESYRCVGFQMDLTERLKRSERPCPEKEICAFNHFRGNILGICVRTEGKKPERNVVSCILVSRCDLLC